MLKYIKGHLTSIDGIEIFPLISLLLFFTFFVVMIVYILTVSKETIDEVKNIPLEEED